MKNKHIAYLVIGIMTVSLVAGVSVRGEAYQGRLAAPTTRESVNTQVKQSTSVKAPVKSEPTKTTAPVKAPVTKTVR